MGEKRGFGKDFFTLFDGGYKYTIIGCGSGVQHDPILDH